MVEVEIMSYYDFFGFIISLNDNNNLLGEKGMAAKMLVFLLSRDHLTDISEKRRGVGQFVRTAVFAVFHQRSFNVTPVKRNHRRFFLI